MTATHTRAGKEQERKIVRWARLHGFAHADRIIRTGAGKDYGTRPDEGDLWLCPGVVVQSKRLSPVNRMERAVPIWLEQTEAQRVASNADVALLVVRREGCSDVGQWWCFLSWKSICSLHGFTPEVYADIGPLRMQVSAAAQMLRRHGYGQELS